MRDSRPVPSVETKGGTTTMKRYVMVAALLAAVFALPAAGASAGTPPSPPHEEHFTHCALDATLPFEQWQEVRMLLTPSGDTFWITSPSAFAGHYLIQSYRNFLTRRSPVLVSGRAGSAL